MSTENFDLNQEKYWDNTINIRTYDNPVVKAFAKQRIEFIRKNYKSSIINSALEVGCGDGFGMNYMKEIIQDIHGCDNSQKMLDNNPINDNKSTTNSTNSSNQIESNESSKGTRYDLLKK